MKQRREIPASFFFFGLVSKMGFESVIVVDQDFTEGYI